MGLEQNLFSLENIANRCATAFYLIRNGRFAYISPRAAAIAGYSREELIGRKAISLVHPDDRERVHTSARTLLGMSSVEPHTYRIFTKDKAIRYIQESISCIRNGNSMKAILGNAVDITAYISADNKNQQALLRSSEEQFRTLFNNIEDIVLLKDCERRHVMVNYAYCRILEIPESYVIGKRTEDFPFFADLKRESNIIRETDMKALEGETVRYELNLSAENSQITYLINKSPLRDTNGKINGICVIGRDIAEYKKLERQFNQIQKMEAIGTLAGGIAHDFNNLLMNIQGYISLIRHDIDPSFPHYHKLETIEEQIHTGAELTKQLLGFARGGQYEVMPVSLNAIIEKSMTIFGHTRKEIVLHRNFQQDIWTVEVDKGQIEQVLLNLFVNASDAMPTGGILFIQTANIILDESFKRPYYVKKGRYVKISVTDNGIGMDEKTKERIFEPFFTTKERGRGTGLGLASVYGIIKGHQGYIDVYSEKGHGTTFNIYLPASDKAVVMKEKKQFHKASSGRGTILIIDDETTILEICSEFLEMIGYRVLTAANGQEGIAIYKSEKEEIELVILDMIMPEIGADKVFIALKEINPAIKVILSSGYSINSQAKKIMEQGCNAFLQKPFSLNELSNRIKEAINKEG